MGGFLGIGEHDVAVTFDKLKWVNEPIRSAAATTNAPGSAARNTDGTMRTTTAPAATDGTASTATGAAATDNTARQTTGAATATTTTRSANDWYPDHVVYNATKDQLKAMPQFKY